MLSSIFWRIFRNIEKFLRRKLESWKNLPNRKGHILFYGVLNILAEFFARFSQFFSGSTRKTWTTRRSFFKRRKGGRSSSRESSAAKELASYSDMASLNYSDSGALHEVEPQINSYVRVERLDCEYYYNYNNSRCTIKFR